ncbi:hypothetical protein Abr02nite_10500 [Paractinoplanes brasiliensis]|nr:hypothetical protein Abr02nite_10500 [Actinoplanes brasiliensis]
MGAAGPGSAGDRLRVEVDLAVTARFACSMEARIRAPKGLVVWSAPPVPDLGY